jgi:hypothetical protein
MRSSRLTMCLCILLVPILITDGANAAEPQEPTAAALSNPLAAQSMDGLSVTIDRPLFSPSRRPPAPPAPLPHAEQVVAPPAPPPSPPNLVLYGIVIDGESARAVVRVADNKILRAQIGDDIEGWKVSQIEGRKVVLSLDGRFATFTLFNHDREKRQDAGGQSSNQAGNPQQQTSVQQAATQPIAPLSVQPGKRRRSRE